MNTIEVQFPDPSEPVSYIDLVPRTVSAACSAKLQAHKDKLVQRFASEFSELKNYLVRQAVEDAHSLASLTAFPHLLLPVLAEEKIQTVRFWIERQQAIRQRSTWAFAT